MALGTEIRRRPARRIPAVQSQIAAFSHMPEKIS
jgi:hypothetical protein